MSLTKRIQKKKYILSLIILAIFVGVIFYRKHQKPPASRQSDRVTQPIISVTLPEQLTLRAQTGKGLFEANCASCHGPNGAGQHGIAPPLVHRLYELSHHGDESFQRAVARGVRAHHWPFGNMPPIEGLTRSQVSNIITYIRELQRVNGIF